MLKLISEMFELVVQQSFTDQFRLCSSSAFPPFFLIEIGPSSFSLFFNMFSRNEDVLLKEKPWVSVCLPSQRVVGHWKINWFCRRLVVQTRL